MIEIIPAIDIRDGNCVRLDQGMLDKETIFSKDPLLMAKIWEKKGATRLHLVDLDGAFNGLPRNFEVVKKIVKTVSIPVQLGGGIRSLEIIETVLGSGIDRVILGTSAYNNLEMVKLAIKKYKNKIIIGVDAKNGKVAIQGWEKTTDLNVDKFVKNLETIGVDTIIYTDISKDGMLEGPNIESITQIAKLTKMSVIASGGISSLEDIKNIKKLYKYGVCGVIIGKALYTNALKLEDILKS